MSGFDAINDDIRAGGGSWLKLNQTGQEITAVVVDVVRREKVFKGNKVLNSKTGEPRIEWVFTLDVAGEIKKWAAGEVAQWAIRNSLSDGQKIEKGGQFKLKVTKGSVQGESQAEVEVVYTAPKFQELPDDSDVPF